MFLCAVLQTTIAYGNKNKPLTWRNDEVKMMNNTILITNTCLNLTIHIEMDDPPQVRLHYSAIITVVSHLHCTTSNIMK